MIKATQSSPWRSNMKLRDVWKLSMILFAALFVGCSTAEDVGYPPMTQEQAQAFFDQYSELLMAGDLEGWLALWTEDGVQMPFDEPRVVGMDELRARNAPAMAAADYDVSIRNLEVRSFGDLAFASGVYTMDVAPKDGPEPWVLDAKYLSIFERQPDRSWKLLRDAFSSNVPQPLLASSRIHHLEQLTQDEIAALDRERTIFFLTFGNLEEHGPHLPVGSDYYRAVGIRDRLIDRLHAAYPDYHFVLFPVIPIGEGGANNLARQPDHIGTYSVRYTTLRAVAIDLGGTIARKGFRNIFVIEAHGSALHNVAFNQACDLVSETYGTRMVNITSMSKTIGGSSEILDEFLGPDGRERSGFVGHAGVSETSEVLAVRGGEFVKPDYKNLELFDVDGFRGFGRTYEMTGWRGYWGSPALASRKMGEALIGQRVDAAFRIAEASLGGEDLSAMPRYPDNNPNAISEGEESRLRTLARYERQRSEIERWLQQNPWPPSED